MWAFISSRLRHWIILAVAVPLATALVRLIRTRIEKKQGETTLTRALKRAEDFGQQKRRGGRRAAATDGRAVPR